MVDPKLFKIHYIKSREVIQTVVAVENAFNMVLRNLSTFSNFAAVQGVPKNMFAI